MEPRNSPFSNNEDRISNLPEPLIHHILSFLHMRYVVQTSVLSRRWRNLLTSLPTLNFYDMSFSVNQWHDGMVDFVDRVLLLRDSSNIQRFHLVWRDEDATESRLNTWILSAVKRNVQELHVHVTVYQHLLFPPCLFNCKSLTKLKLKMGNKYESKINLPNSMGLPRLKSLKLSSLSFVDENLINKLFSSCPVLESLIIVDSDMNFNISSLSLKSFKYYNYWHGVPGDGRVKTVKLYAPNLTSFICKEYMTQNYSLENLSSLVTADLDMIAEDDENDETPETYSGLSTGLKELFAQRMMNFLRAVHNVKDLKLSPGFLEVVSGALDLSDSRSPQFRNLRRLKLTTWVSRNCMNAITYLLQTSPNIEFIGLRIIQLNSADIGNDWEERLPLSCMLHHLKIVNIRGIIGCANELKFLEILLKNAIVLEELGLVSFVADSPDRESQLLEFKEKLLTFPRASSSVTIFYKF